MPIYATLLLLSFTIGGICYLYAFDKEHFLKGTKYIHKNIIKFGNWYNL